MSCFNLLLHKNCRVDARLATREHTNANEGVEAVTVKVWRERAYSVADAENASLLMLPPSLHGILPQLPHKPSASIASVEIGTTINLRQPGHPSILLVDVLRHACQSTVSFLETFDFNDTRPAWKGIFF